MTLVLAVQPCYFKFSFVHFLGRVRDIVTTDISLFPVVIWRFQFCNVNVTYLSTKRKKENGLCQYAGFPVAASLSSRARVLHFFLFRSFYIARIPHNLSILLMNSNCFAIFFSSIQDYVCSDIYYY